ncbi:DUF2079 domain-containing protein [Acidiferrimicrobium sp. IK]|uniref:DUF2079 domain-containing protein n=1 Tax=Acidiferrimicrobium sp. IK TaxID=2871700 RepID=UPI0021CAEDC9|nr:DUF2079 domain-containing protein [Acidiferrimicrobium sp. IK]MCU4183504.1 DUF2079 domain-containing protein [Acidiferrimicrobium sp. IK]
MTRSERVVAAGGAHRDAAATREASPAGSGPWRSPRLLAGAVLAGYLAVLVAISLHEYRTFNLSWDFGQAEQAWHLIAHGTLDPYDSLHHHAWWQDHAALLIWLLAPLYWLAPNDGLTLLVVQDVAIVVAVAAAADWAVLFCTRRGARPAVTATCVSALLALCVFNVGLYATVLYDFHDQVLGVAFLVLTGRDVYAGRNRRAVLWAALTLLSMDLSALNLAALGAGLALTERRLRRPGVAMVAAGAAWYLAAGLLGGTKGTTLSYYDALAGRRLTGGLGDYLSILRGAAAHPSRVWHQLTVYRYRLYEDLIPSGVIGLLEPAVLLPIIVVVVPGALSSYGGFVKLGFQNCAAYILAALGTALVLARMATRPGHRSRLWPVVAVAAGAVAVGLACDGSVAVRGAEVDYSVSGAAAHQLAAVRQLTPAEAEVAVPFGVVGRFSGRRYVYLIHDLPWTLPVRASRVEVVFAPRAGNEWLPLPKVAAAEAALVGRYRARVLYLGSEVQAYTVEDAPIGATITLP